MVHCYPRLQFSGLAFVILCFLISGCRSSVQLPATTKPFTTHTPTLLAPPATETALEEPRTVETTSTPTRRPTRFPEEKPTQMYDEKFEAGSIQGDTPEQIAEAIFRAWLERFITNPGDPRARLLDYRIEKVEIPEEWEYCAPLRQVDFIASVVYSVQPETSPPARWAGATGYNTDDNWIRDKHSDIAVRRLGTDYYLDILGVPPCPAINPPLRLP